MRDDYSRYPIVVYYTTLTQSSRLSLGLHQAQDVVLSDWALDVSDDGSASVLQELHSDLGDTASGAGSAQHFDNLGQGNWRLSVHADIAEEENFHSQVAGPAGAHTTRRCNHPPFGGRAP